jgi:hypothetical protein
MGSILNIARANEIIPERAIKIIRCFHSTNDFMNLTIQTGHASFFTDHSIVPQSKLEKDFHKLPSAEKVIFA